MPANEGASSARPPAETEESRTTGPTRSSTNPTLAPDASDLVLPESALEPEHPVRVAYRATLAHRLEPPEDWTARTLERWSQAQRSWTRRRNELREATFNELVQVITGGNRIFNESDAILGLLMEDMARQLLAVPIPEELTGDGDREQYLARFWNQLLPVLSGAVDTFRDCVERETGNPEWRRLCQDRYENLQSVLAGPVQPYEQMTSTQQAAVLALMARLREARTLPRSAR